MMTMSTLNSAHNLQDLVRPRVDRCYSMPLALKGNGLTTGKETYLHQLTPEQVEECVTAMRKFMNSGDHYGYIAQETFELPVLGQILRQRSKELHNATGLLILRGLKTEEYTTEEFIVLQAGISSYIGSKRGVQNGNVSSSRSVCLHVTDHNVAEIRQKEPRRFVPNANTNAKMAFHTDSGEIISLGYRQVSQIGGELHVASAMSIYKKLLDHPEVLATLRNPWPWHMVGNIPETAHHGLLHETYDSDGKLQITLMSEHRPFFGDEYCPRLASLPELTPDQKHALNMIQKLAGQVHTTVTPQAGDIVFLNNRATLHARSSYVDVDKDPKKRRHVIRIVLRDEKLGWDVPEELQQRYRTMYGRTNRPEDEDWPITARVWGTDPQHG